MILQTPSQLKEESDNEESSEESSEEEDDEILDDIDDPAVGDAPDQIVQNPFYEGSDDDKSGSDDASELEDEDEQDSDSKVEEGPDDIDSDDSDFDSDDDSDDSDDGGDDMDDKNDEADKGFNDEEDLIAALKSAREKKARDCPPDIKLKESATDISFHPEENIIAVSNLLGELSIFSCSNEENKALKKLKLHKGGIRSIEYSVDGKHILTAGKDKTVKVVDVETWNLMMKEPLSHPSPLYSLAPLSNGCVSGDEDGTVKFWDFRTKKNTLTSKRFDEFVSSIYADEEKKVVIATSGEGTIQSWDMRMNKPDIQSEVYDSELNCLSVVREGTKVVVGSGEGIMYIFNQGEYGYHSDQYPGHPDSINSMIGVTDNVVITGCEDGTLRAVHLFPHRFVGQVGHHGGDMPVEKIDVNADGDVIASVGHDNRVKFWNIGYLEKMDYEKKRKPIVQKSQVVKKRKLAEAVARETEHQLPSSGRVNKKEFFQGFKD
eukprot:TRINITY_DN4550_c0_g1_i5.p1 TRINITY_DN4550_c0_g1~~TRINITY_DN4550_c0_g1_i5.p1  ORF type:complete len:490 (-),score=137.15 TRINITY_DN4550_c0_g1_i5:1909-3378(-)